MRGTSLSLIATRLSSPGCRTMAFRMGSNCMSASLTTAHHSWPHLKGRLEHPSTATREDRRWSRATTKICLEGVVEGNNNNVWDMPLLELILKVNASKRSDFSLPPFDRTLVSTESLDLEKRTLAYSGLTPQSVYLNLDNAYHYILRSSNPRLGVSTCQDERSKFDARHPTWSHRHSRKAR
jgi:hypothetical protein